MGWSQLMLREDVTQSASPRLTAGKDSAVAASAGSWRLQPVSPLLGRPAETSEMPMPLLSQVISESSGPA